MTPSNNASRLASGWLYWPVCLTGCALVAAGVLGPEAQRRLAVERQCAEMEAEVGALGETRDRLDAARQALQDDPAYLETVARHELGVVRPGETRLPQPQPLRPARTEQTVAAEPVSIPGLEFLALFSESPVRTASFAIGGALLLGAVLASLPSARSRPARV